jgi:uncharacterized protein
MLFAAQRGDLATVQALIDAKADPLYKAPNGNTAFQIALSRGHEPVSKLLLAHGSEVNGRDGSGSTPLHEAVRQGKIELVRDLVARGADLHARTVQPPGAPASPFRSSAGLTPFLTAAESGNVAMMKELIKLGADPMAKTPDGAGGLLLATGSRKLEAVKLMIELGSDVNERRTAGFGVNPIHTATRFGALEIIQYLVDHGADLTVRDRNGRTPLEEAEFEAPKATIELLRKLTAADNEKRKATANPK